jgi:membrane protein implicated in regulation of membrane protease activity
MSARGQAEFKVVAALLNISAVAAVVQAVGDSIHIVPDAVWHAGSWIVAALVAVVAYFGRRLLTEIERDIEEERRARHKLEMDVRAVATRLTVMETTCAMLHGPRSGGETRP